MAPIPLNYLLSNYETFDLVILLQFLYFYLSETRLIFWSMGKTTKKERRSVGKIKIISFDS